MGVRAVWLGALLIGCAADKPVVLDEPDDATETGDEDGFPVYDKALAPPENGVQIHLKPFWLQPGKEKERCWFIQADNDMPATVTKMEIVARPGMHHSILTKTDQRFDNHKEDCFGFPTALLGDFTGEFPSPMFGTSTQVYEESLEFPEGVGVRIQGSQQFVLNYHYLNATTERIPAEIWVNLYFAEPGEVQEYAETYFYGNVGGIGMDPYERQTITTECDMPNSVNVVSMTPHLHERGSHFSAWRDGDEGETFLYEEEGWFDPQTQVFEPVVPFGMSDKLRFTCEWENDTDQFVRFGETSEDEMCFAFGHYYPASQSLFGIEGYGCEEVENITTPLD